MKRSLQWVLIFFFIFFARTACAVQVNTLYQGEVPVASQSEADRVAKLPAALAQVFIKVSGNSHILDNPAVQSHLNNKNATGLMQEYSYSSAIPPYQLQVRFDVDGVNKILRDAAVSMWGVNRPLILAWVEYEIPNRVAEIIDTTSKNEIFTTIKNHANQRGLPILFPMMDMMDLNQVSVNQIVMMEIPNLQTAAKRYASDAILIVRVFQLTTGFSAEAKLVLGANQWDFHILGKTIPDVLSALIDNVTDTLASRYGTVVTNTVQTQILLKVIGISQQDDFSHLMRYIQHLTPVASVQIEKITGSDVTLNISLRGTRESFMQILSTGNKLTAVPAPDNNLIYQWNH